MAKYDESIEVNKMDKIILNEKYAKVQKVLYEKHYIEAKNDIDVMLNDIIDIISYMIAEGLQLAETLEV